MSHFLLENINSKVFLESNARDAKGGAALERLAQEVWRGMKKYEEVWRSMKK